MDKKRTSVSDKCTELGLSSEIGCRRPSNRLCWGRSSWRGANRHLGGLNSGSTANDVGQVRTRIEQEKKSLQNILILWRIMLHGIVLKKPWRTAKTA